MPNGICSINYNLCTVRYIVHMYICTYVPYVRDEIKKFSQRYTNRLEKHPNILAIDLPTSNAETSRRLKRKHYYIKKNL